MSYKTYAEAKMANPDSDIFTNDKEFKAVKDAPTSHFPNGWVVCNPADYCSSLKEFLEYGFKLGEGDKFIRIDGVVVSVNNSNSSNIPNHSNANRYILSAAALNGGCKIPVKGEQWTVYNNTLPLCELTDEQAAMLFNSWRGGVEVECKGLNGKFRSTYELWCIGAIYRIKQKSEREMFIDEAISHAIKPETQSAKQMFGELFDSGKFKYIDNTQHFGENI